MNIFGSSLVWRMLLMIIRLKIRAVCAGDFLPETPINCICNTKSESDLYFCIPEIFKTNVSTRFKSSNHLLNLYSRVVNSQSLF